MKQETIMKGILGALVVIALLVGCQTTRSFRLPTDGPHIQTQDAPAALYLEQPEDEPEVVSDDPIIQTVMMFRKACVEQGAFWIKIQGRTEQFNCELVE